MLGALQAEDERSAETQGDETGTPLRLKHHFGIVLLLCAVLAVTRVAAGSAVLATAMLPTSSTAATSSVTPTSSVVPTATPYVVVIDAGHQLKADMRTEPIGPGSSARKPRVESGAAGVVTHRPESLDNLQIALKLRDVLVKRGVTVVMVRTKQKVDIPNSKRAKIANAAHADLFVRLHCDGVTSSSVKGVLTLVPAKNKWTSPIVKASARSGRDIQRAVVKLTHAKNRGITKRGDLSGFNWSKVPTSLIEMGLMSNRAEDRKLASASYQNKLAVGIANGIMSFLAGK